MEAPFLAALGVPAHLVTRPPHPEIVPALLNPQAHHLWPEAVGVALHSNGIDAQWRSAIDTFFELAVQRQLHPLTNAGGQTSNDAIVLDLTRARQAIVNFVNRSRLMSFVRMRTGIRRVELNQLGGFTLSVDGRAILTDPTFKAWLTQRPLPNLVNHGYWWTRKLAKDVTFFVYNEGADMSQRWHVGYSIHVNTWPYVPGKAAATPTELEEFVLDILWRQISIGKRPDGQMAPFHF